MTTKRNYFATVSHQFAKKCSMNCIISEEDFLRIFREDMDRKIPYLIPFMDEVMDKEIHTMNDLYEWAYRDYPGMFIRWNPGKSIERISIDNGNIKVADWIDLSR